MILFKDIYQKAINLFDDPDIHYAYIYNIVQWEKMMYRYLQNGITLFTNPTKIAFLLVNQESPVGKLEIFDGNGTAVYTLSTTPLDNSDFYCTIDGKADREAVYDKDTNAVTLSRSVSSSEKVAIEWYFAGQFNDSFITAATAQVPANVISDKVREILARALVLSWAENEKNFALDIRNLLTDTDFKIYSPANSIRAKVEWVKQLQFDFDTLQTKLAWDVYARKQSGGSYYGA